ncbi:hypothetical protein [Chryseobacterium sp.]|uniref:hypothetical protein n=1 Tax=Chryseobacterium sp. TaxID=1871047 RepID=UPI0012A7F573|nr:hypothetical protein [Chryseobacterium sp.]QFG54467.1 hypothetical protein F7R58_12695 [Chryseobacterium sp.]
MKNYLFAILGLLLWNCQRDPLLIDAVEIPNNNMNFFARAANENQKPDQHTQIILGQQLINPYSVANMQNAFDYYNDVVSNSPFTGMQVSATHYYIKLNPQSEADLEAIDNLDNESNADTPVLHDYPLDYDVVQEGDYYVMPQNEDDLYHSLYTVIPVGYKMPSGVQYDVIEELYQPTDDEYDVETVSLFFADWQDDLEADGISLTEESLPEYLNGQQGLMAMASNNKFYPSGKITLENTGTNLTEGLMKAEISYGRVFWWHYTYTDNNGNFNGTAKKYRGDVQIRAKWRGNTATIRKTWNEVLGIAVSDYLMTVNKNTTGTTKHIPYSTFASNGNHLWTKGTVNNGLRKYVDYCNTYGISNTISNANVWAWEGAKESGATPMLYKYQQLPLMASFANIGEAPLWNVLNNFTTGFTINLVPKHLRPDQIYTGVNPRSNETRSDSRRIHQLIFHEAAHYSHAAKTGATYWAQLFASELSNIHFTSAMDPYQNGASPSLQTGARIGLGEGWATFAEFSVTHFYYSSSIVSTNTGRSRQQMGVVNGILEGFSIYDRPMTSTRYDDRSWFAHGLMVDLMDVGRNNGTFDPSVHRSGTGTQLNYILDEVSIQSVSQYNLAPIFSRLTSSVHSAADLKAPLQSAYPAQSSQINTLFQHYGY